LLHVLLVLSQVPNKAQVDAVTADLKARSKIPEHLYSLLNAMPPGTHPMTQFATLVMALQVSMGLMQVLGYM
jgi:citrate synthase